VSAEPPTPRWQPDPERDERIRADRAAVARRARERTVRDELRRDLARVSTETDAGARGRALRSVLDRLFTLDGLRLHEPFQVVDDRVEGSIELDGTPYLVELHWVDDVIGRSELARHLERLATRSEPQAIFISLRFSPLAVVRSRESPTMLSEVDEILLVLERHGNVAAYFREKR
jgi:restriction system protein